MELSDIVSLIGIGLTFLVSISTLIYTVIRNRHSNFISNVTYYRLKWIDLVRPSISEYLFSLDKLSRGDDTSLEDDFAIFLEKHWQMQSFLTTFSPNDSDAQRCLDLMYKSVSELIDPNCNNRVGIREKIHNMLPEMDMTLRKLMDKNWFEVKKEVK